MSGKCHTIASFLCTIPPGVKISVGGGRGTEPNLVITPPHNVGNQFAWSICLFLTTICHPLLWIGIRSRAYLPSFPSYCLTTSFATNGMHAIAIRLIYSKFSDEGIDKVWETMRLEKPVWCFHLMRAVVWFALLGVKSRTHTHWDGVEASVEQFQEMQQGF